MVSIVILIVALVVFPLIFYILWSMNVSSCSYICSCRFCFNFLLLVFKINVFSYLISILVVFLLIYIFLGV
jgi:hypothetical protein